MIIDTNIFIDFLRGNDEAIKFIGGLRSVSTSVIVVSELFAGVKTRTETEELRAMLEFVRQVDVNKTIAEEAGLMRRRFHRSHGIELPDALIVATAHYEGAAVASLNKKHFSVLTENLIIPY